MKIDSDTPMPILSCYVLQINLPLLTIYENRQWHTKLLIL